MTKTCARCKEEKPRDTGFSKNSTRPDGRQSWCKTCNTETRTAWARNNKDRVAQHARYTRYRLTEEQYQALIIGQHNRCAICKDEFSKTPHVDHNHETGQVRGLLCGRCNTFVGYLETKNLVSEAVEYLEGY